MLQNRFYRSEKTFAVETERHFFDVFAVQFRFYGDFEFVAPVDLRPARKPGLHVICAVFIAFRNQIVLIPERGTRSDNRHLPREDIKNLRQFVKACFSQKSADFRYVLLGIFEHVRRHIVRRGSFHRAKFQNFKKLFLFADPFLSKENRPRVVDENRDRQNQPHGSQYDYPYK